MEAAGPARPGGRDEWSRGGGGGPERRQVKEGRGSRCEVFGVDVGTAREERWPLWERPAPAGRPWAGDRVREALEGGAGRPAGVGAERTSRLGRGLGRRGAGSRRALRGPAHLYRE